ncbi:MAG: BREX-2 system phosphatase PglZ [Burkholderiales bacterium]|nr:BREX-2 system phosphatase PglZ [Burkholderiales bacterium]
MSTAPVVSSAQAAAQLDAVLDRDAQASVVAIRAAAPLDGVGSIARRGRSFSVRWCASRLAMRDALSAFEDSPGDGLLLLTPLSDTDMPDDVAARLARGRIFQPGGWEMVRQMFSAQGTDARLGRYEWMPQALIEGAESGPYVPVASGFLDLETAWREVLQRCLELPDARPDAATLMRWALRPDLPVLLGRLSAKARSDAFEWLASHAGMAGQLTIRCIDAGRAADAAALGVVCGVIFAAASEGIAELAQAAVRLERYVGDQHVTVQAGRDWADQAARLLSHTEPEEARPVVDRADALLRELRVAGFAHLSDWTPAGLEQRLGRFAAVLTDRLGAATEAASAAIEEAANDVLAHRLAALQPLRAVRVRMARRLARWLARPGASPGGLDAQVALQADEEAFVDWSRFRLLGGDELPDLSQAYARLRAAAAQRREASNKAFATALAGQVREARPLGSRAVPVEAVLERVLAPLAASQPVLLLVIDGLSMAIFRELFERPEREGWVEWLPDALGRPLVGVAALPTITEVSRASLLCGRLCTGTAPNEKTGFASHAALLAHSANSQPPRLFHKGDLSEDGNLSEEVRSALANQGQKVVGIVYNAVDDHLSGPDQLQQRWSLEGMRLLLPLLREARHAKRVVLVTADHGHVLEESSEAMPGGSNDRWRAGATPAHAKEVLLAGGRVLTPDGETRVVCLWSEAARYTGRKNGYHGGASPAEVLVPLAVLAPFGVNVPGWKPAPPQQPEWWDLPAIAVKGVAPPAPAQKTTTRRPAPKPAGQGGLFGDEELPVPTTTVVGTAAADWIGTLLASPIYASQRQLAARVALADPQMRQLLAALDERGGKLSRGALAQRMGVPELRLGGMLSAARRTLNVDQAAVLAVDEAAGMVELNRSLLLQQFRLTVGGSRR